MDEEPEHDEGYVTLVNTKMENGELVETTDTKSGLWAWKHPHHDGTITLAPLRGDVASTRWTSVTCPTRWCCTTSLYAKPGQKIAFVGATGAGKTTITNLINRFYDIADGKIRYDGININKIKKARPAPVARHGAAGREPLHRHRDGQHPLRQARRHRRGVHRRGEAGQRRTASSALPDGYNTVLNGDGSGLSQGQRQLLSIARAAVADPPAMILDEATSSIDTRTEAIVQNGMDELMTGRTTFVIAHRLSTVRNFDVIMVLDHGRIIERGSHDDLIAQNGRTISCIPAYLNWSNPVVRHSVCAKAPIRSGPFCLL